MKTYDCVPTMTDTEVMEFCRRGFTVLEAVVPPEIDRRTLEFLDAFYANQPSDLPERTATIPTDLFSEDWFWDNVILNSHVIGVVRSLLGKDFSLPEFLSNHRIKCPVPVGPPGETGHLWHRDGVGGMGVPDLERVDFSESYAVNGAQNCLQVFYYPQDVPLQLGPTELVPGSHLIQSNGQYEVPYFLNLVDCQGDVAGSYHRGAPAGSITITAYSIWHRRTASTGQGIRNNLKYRYLRNTKPHRDWIVEQGFDIPGRNRVNASQIEGAPEDATNMFRWLSGMK